MLRTVSQRKESNRDQFRPRACNICDAIRRESASQRTPPVWLTAPPLEGRRENQPFALRAWQAARKGR